MVLVYIRPFDDILCVYMVWKLLFTYLHMDISTFSCGYLHVLEISLCTIINTLVIIHGNRNIWNCCTTTEPVTTMFRSGLSEKPGTPQGRPPGAGSEH